MQHRLSLRYPAQEDFAQACTARDFDQPHEQRCQYAGRRCYKPRAIKLDGSLHRMCHSHRMLANRNQRLSQTRRRRQNGARHDTVSLSNKIAASVSKAIPIQPTVFPHDAIATSLNSLWTILSSSAEDFFDGLFGEPTPPKTVARKEPPGIPPNVARLSGEESQGCQAIPAPTTTFIDALTNRNPEPQSPEYPDLSDLLAVIGDDSFIFPMETPHRKLCDSTFNTSQHLD
jgi:hypothetical protein